MRRDEQSFDLALVRPAQDVVAELEEERVKGRFAARKQHDGKLAFSGDQRVHAALELLHRHRIALLVAHDTDRAGEIANIIDFEARKAGVLEVVFTQPAVQRAAVLDLRREIEWHGAGLRVRERFDVILSVAGNLDFKETVLRTFLLHPHAVFAQYYMSVNELLAMRAGRAR